MRSRAGHRPQTQAPAKGQQFLLPMGRPPRADDFQPQPGIKRVTQFRGETWFIHQNVQSGSALRQQVFQPRRRARQMNPANDPAEAAVAGWLRDQRDAMRPTVPKTRPQQRPHAKPLGLLDKRHGPVEIVGVRQG